MPKSLLATPTANFTKEQRLLTPAAFREVFDAPERKIHQSHLMAFVRPSACVKPRIGMAITKRKVPTAVVRNLIKRHIREQFRTKAFKLENKDIVFIVKKSIKDIDNKELKNEINNIFKKIEKNKMKKLLVLINKIIFVFILNIIKFYQKIISPIIPARCRYYPTCSNYGKQALAWHGTRVGSWLLLKRLSKCHPLGGHGIDFVPLPLSSYRYQYIPSTTSSDSRGWGVYRDRQGYVPRLNYLMKTT